MRITVTPEPIGKKLHRLEIYADGRLIGEYERAQAADIDRKIVEVEKAADLLLAIHAKYGEFQVRWSRERRAKIVRVGNTERGFIPRECWQTPSWEERRSSL
jgi:hypothetical protein